MSNTGPPSGFLSWFGQGPAQPKRRAPAPVSGTAARHGRRAVAGPAQRDVEHLLGLRPSVSRWAEPTSTCSSAWARKIRNTSGPVGGPLLEVGRGSRHLSQDAHAGWRDRPGPAGFLATGAPTAQDLAQVGAAVEHPRHRRGRWPAPPGWSSGPCQSTRADRELCWSSSEASSRNRAIPPPRGCSTGVRSRRPGCRPGRLDWLEV